MARPEYHVGPPPTLGIGPQRTKSYIDELDERSAKAAGASTGLFSEHNDVNNDALQADHPCAKRWRSELSENDLNRAAWTSLQKGLRQTSRHHTTHLSLAETPIRMRQSAKVPNGELQLDPHQLEAVGWLIKTLREKKGAMLADEMGLGKTLTLIALILCLRAPNKKPTLIVAPPSVLDVWEKEIAASVANPPLRVLNGRNGISLRPAEIDEYDVVLATYTQLQMEFDDLHQLFDGIMNVRRGFAHASGTRVFGHYPILAHSWGYIVLDEAHHVRNTHTSISKGASILKAEYRVALTGSPLVNDYPDIASICNFIHGDPWGDLVFFYDHFVFKKSTERKAQVLQRDRNAVLALSLRDIMLRRKRDDYFNDKIICNVPKPVEIVENVRLSNQEKDDQEATRYQWDELTRHKWLADRKRGVASGMGFSKAEAQKQIHLAAVKLLHPSCYFLESDDDNEKAPRDPDFYQKLRTSTRYAWNASSRIKRCLEIIQERKSHGRVLVFCGYRMGLEILCNALDSEDITWEALNGGVPIEERSRIVANFQDVASGAPGPEVLLATSGAGGEGLTLTAAKTVILLSPHWNPKVDEQNIGRAVCRGQTAHVHVYRLHARFSIERKIRREQEIKLKKSKLLIELDSISSELKEEIRTWDENEFRSRLTSITKTKVVETVERFKRMMGLLANSLVRIRDDETEFLDEKRKDSSLEDGEPEDFEETDELDDDDGKQAYQYLIPHEVSYFE